jgi:hypothetical protein
MKIDFLGLLDDGTHSLTVILVGSNQQSMYADGPKIFGQGSGRPWSEFWSTLVGYVVSSGWRSGQP